MLIPSVPVVILHILIHWVFCVHQLTLSDCIKTKMSTICFVGLHLFVSANPQEKKFQLKPRWLKADIRFLGNKLSCWYDSRRTEYNIWYNCRPLTGINMVSMSINFSTVSNLHLLFEVSGLLFMLSPLWCFLDRRYSLQQKWLMKWTWNTDLATGGYNFCCRLQLSIPYTNPERHNAQSQTYIIGLA